MNKALKKTISRAIALAKREESRAAKVLKAAHAKYEKARIKAMVAAAKKGKEATGLKDLPAFKALATAQREHEGIANNLASFKRMAGTKKKSE